MIPSLISAVNSSIHASNPKLTTTQDYICPPSVLWEFSVRSVSFNNVVDIKLFIVAISQGLKFMRLSFRYSLLVLLA